MLQKHPQTLSNDACNDCNWNLFDAIEVKDQHSEIFLAKNKNNCFFQNQRQNLDPNSFMPRKKKLSLRRNRQIALKENIPVLTIVGQQELLNNTWAKTGLMTRADSQMIRTVNEYPPQNQFSCFSSYVFEEINPNEHQRSFGRFIEFNRSGEVMKNQKVITRSKYKSITEINLQNTPAISDRTKKQFSKQNIYKNQVLVENKRSSKSEAGGEVLQINNFFSQPHIKNYLSVANEYQKLDSSIMLNMKDIKYPKKAHLLESLKFKDTESINDEQSSLFSEVLSEQSELTNDKGQFSLVIMPKLNNRRNIVIPKQSKFK